MTDAAGPRLEGLTIGEVLRACLPRLRSAGVDAPERDARLLLGWALGCSALELLASPGRRLSAAQAQQVQAALDRRAAREPVSRIVGRRAFHSHEFLIGPATLDPRPDTETVVELALELAREEGWQDRSIRIVDVGTGSGCILLSLLAELPRACGVGTDIEPAALAVAERNAEALGLSDRVRFEQRRSLEGVEGPFDLLVSNPPYIPTSQISGLEPEVRTFDPFIALNGGADGLDVYRQIAARIHTVVPRGWAVLEGGAGQAPEILEIFDPDHRLNRRSRADLGGHVRTVAISTLF